MEFPSASSATKSRIPFTGYEKFVIGILTFLQFTLILDFMIMSPLGAILMPKFGMTASQFGWVVSIYAFSAGFSGFVAAGYADRFDRKKLLVFFYFGFLFGTLCCALAPNYETLLAARMVTGIFGGVIGSVVMAITTDLFSPDVRGRVIGTLQTAFSASQVLGIPIGLFIANLFGWHAPFVLIVAIGLIVGLLIVRYLKPVDAHLKLDIEQNAFVHLVNTATKPRYVFAFLAMGLLTTGGYMLLPFGSAITVNNFKIPLETLPMIYLISGICTIFTGPLVGKLSDTFGAMRVFWFGVALTILMVYIYTHLGPSTVPIVVVVNSILFVGIFSRLIPAQAMIVKLPSPQNRGAFMAISASVQQVVGGCASALAGLIVTVHSDGTISNVEMLGYVLIAVILISGTMIHFINKMVNQKN
jgi:predicted MFS family arabinose efflux permease